MWDDLWRALALLLVLEGILPFLNPASMRRSLLQMATLSDRTLRIGGLISMAVGVLFLYFIN